MKKIIISQPLENKTPQEIIETEKEARKYLETKGYKVENKFFINEKWLIEQLGIKNQTLYDVGKLFETMSTCDAVYFTDGWALSKECRIIRLAAILYNFEILEENNKDKEEQHGGIS